MLAEAHLEPSQTSTMELCFQKGSMEDLQQGSKYASDLPYLTNFCKKILILEDKIKMDMLLSVFKE